MIAFSGIDCGGKSTQIELLRKAMEEKGIHCEVVWSRIGYTPGISFLKKLIRGNKSGSKEETLSYSAKVNANPRKRKMLFTAGLIDLCLYYSITLRLKEAFGRRVICDRYVWDSAIDCRLKYPDYSLENNFWWKLTLKCMVKPKPSFCLTIPAEESMRRSALKEEPFPEPIETRRERIELYHEYIRQGCWEHIIDATASIEDVFKIIMEHCK